MKAIINKLFAVFSAIVLVTGNCDVSYAGSHQVPDKNCSVSVNCPEYPDAYIEVTIDEETHNRAYASVYVCEQYSVVDGESKIV